MKAMLIWSNGTTINTHIFEDKDGKTGYERAVEAMHREYDEHNSHGNASEEFGAFRGDESCCYSAEDEDMCFWQVEKLPEKKSLVIPNVLSQSERCELFGCLINVVENFLEEKGVTPDMIPNNERGKENNTALIYGSDYDYLTGRFSTILGVERDTTKYSQQLVEEVADMLPDEILEAAYRKRELQYRIQDAKNHAEELNYKINDEDADRIARMFLFSQNCCLPENDVFENIIKEYMNYKENQNKNGGVELQTDSLKNPIFDIQKSVELPPFDEEPDYESEER